MHSLPLQNIYNICYFLPLVPGRAFHPEGSGRNKKIKSDLIVLNFLRYFCKSFPTFDFFGFQSVGSQNRSGLRAFLPMAYFVCVRSCAIDNNFSEPRLYERALMKMRATWQYAAMKYYTAYFHLESFVYFSFKEEK